jgi:hypothetical protein
VPDTPQQPANIPFFKMLYLLFFNPKVFEVLAHKGVLRSFVHILLVSLVSSIVIAASYSTQVLESGKKWETFVNRDVGTFGFDDEDKLFWDKPSENPFTIHIDDWRVDFDSMPLDEDLARRGSAKKGIWITRDGITGWDWIEIEPLFKPREEIFRMRTLEQMFPYLVKHGPKKVDGPEEVALFVEQVCMEIISQIGVRSFFSMFFVFGLLSFTFSILYLFSLGNRDPRFRRSLPRLLVVYLHTCIPPIIVGTIYESLHVPAMSFFTVFCIAFFVYHMYVMRHFRRESLLTE